ncbi:hypothetical protein [Candidatus Formimonas warabiya]|uniref:Uncharacterized protein n=1 Tax=Formimonas warabiya TaxID=1761012 RepID=A0A3G1KP19_FORW1|nr:hypothetical protein [Candidatus Formimonas warabiya]ATW23865.1 hypothetical protein DCMF_02785 [Candidatus Formimonas warabiya]
MDILAVIKEKINKKEWMHFVYQEPDGMIRFYAVLPYLLGQSFFQGLTEKGTASFQISNVLTVQPPTEKVSWRLICRKTSLIIFPGKPGAAFFYDLSEKEKNLLMQAFFSRRVIMIGDFIFLQQGEK